MAYSEKLAGRVREALAEVPNMEEKKMFGGIAFMVNGKMCINVGKDRLMCRIDPELHEAAIAKKGCRSVVMKGKQYIGYIHVSEEALKSKKDFDYWVALALDFNTRAKTSSKVKKK